MKPKISIHSLTASERKGTIMLLVLLFIISLSPTIYHRYFYQSEVLNISYLDTLEAEKSSKKMDSVSPALRPKHLSLKTFNQKDWGDCGISREAVKNIHRYLVKGGRFKTIYKLKLTYGLTTEDLKIIRQYLIPAELTELEGREFFLRQKFELNTIDSQTLIKFSGIGPYFASTILKYRERLGGYYSVEQLKEVYKIKPEIIDNISKNLFCNKSLLKTIDINEATYFSLFRHPYISKENAKKILERISHRGDFEEWIQLKKEKIFSKLEYDKVKFYLRIKNKAPL